jgi:hypothetical protein
MSFLSTRKHRIAAAVTAAAIAVGGGSAAIVAATAPASAGTVSLSAATKPASTPAAKADRRHHRHGLLARSDHASIELKVKGHWVTYVLDRGKVTSVSGTAISLARPDGQSVTLTIDSATHFGHKGSATSILTGSEATVISDNGAALRVVPDRHAKAAAAPATATTPA